MYRDRAFDLQGPLPWNARALTQDLALETLVAAMARGDALVRQVSVTALLTPWSNDLDTILYRQAVVRDGLNNPGVLRELYDLTVETIENKRKHYFSAWGTHPSSVLFGAVEIMRMYAGMLRRLRGIARAHAARFSSEAFGTLFATLERELTDEYLDQIEVHLDDLRFPRGTLISARLGPGNVGTSQTLHEVPEDHRPWWRRLWARRARAYSFRLSDRDEAGARALSEIRDRGIHLVAGALARSADHVEQFFHNLCTELAFYVGCLNLHEQLTALGEPTCFPRPLPLGQRRLNCRGLYDPCLAVQLRRYVVGNAAYAENQPLVIITGANQGGKSVFLRSIGLGQLMMQGGMFVGAESFEAEVCGSLITHYRREEDATLKSGKLDEELSRLSEIVDHLTPNALLLLNESFAATNEREGSEIARQVIAALLEKGMKVYFVTHLHSFARGCFERPPAPALFLRAERREDGSRTFRLLEGAPLPTSHGRDLYQRIFALDA